MLELNTISEIGWPVFIEKIGSERPDLHSVLVIGPIGTMYENIPFILDIFLPFRFWDWEKFKDDSLKPKVNIKYIFSLARFIIDIRSSFVYLIAELLQVGFIPNYRIETLQ
jgi:hypothetical protein